MANFVPLGKTSDLDNGAMRRVVVKDKEILLARVEVNFYAVQNRCPHLGADLSKGELVGTVITCPRHGSRFDLSDGRVVRWTTLSGLALAVSRVFRSPRPLITYRVRIEGDTILAEV